MTEVEIQRDILNQVIKKTIGRIKELQKQLEVEKKERHELGSYSDCGEFYREQVIKTESVISELIEQKISLEKWRKKLMFV
jgi:hypothetical protein